MSRSRLLLNGWLLVLLSACASIDERAECGQTRSEMLRVQMRCPSMFETDPELGYQYCLAACPGDGIHTEQCRARCEAQRNGKDQ